MTAQRWPNKEAKWFQYSLTELQTQGVSWDLITDSGVTQSALTHRSRKLPWCSACLCKSSFLFLRHQAHFHRSQAQRIWLLSASSIQILSSSWVCIFARTDTTAVQLGQHVWKKYTGISHPANYSCLTPSFTVAYTRTKSTASLLKAHHPPNPAYQLISVNVKKAREAKEGSRNMQSSACIPSMPGSHSEPEQTVIKSSSCSSKLLLCTCLW